MKKSFKKFLSVFLAMLIASSVSLLTIAAISVPQAKQKALETAGLSSSQAVFTKCTQTQNGFDLAFDDEENQSYKCSVSNDGKVTAYYFDSNKKAGLSRNITAQQAKQIALDAVGESDTAVRKLNASYSFDEFDGAVYTVTFLLDGRSCTFEISAESGEILAYGYEMFDSFDSVIGRVFSVLMKALNFILKFFLS